MNEISLLESGFRNCAFLTRNPKSIETILKRVINSPNVILFPHKNVGVKVETISAMSDKVTLTFDNEEMSSVWTWRNSTDGKSYVLDNIE